MPIDAGVLMHAADDENTVRYPRLPTARSQYLLDNIE